MNLVAHERFELTKSTTEQIAELENAMLSVPDEQKLPFENMHQFAPGIYARTIFMPAGMVLTSKIHKTEHFFVVVKGSCLVIDSKGGKTLIEAPYLGRTLPWTKRALHILEDCIWTTFHPTNLTTVDEIEKEIIADSFEETA